MKMKKFFYGSLFLAIVGIGIVGCEKEEITSPNISPNTSYNVSQNAISSDGEILIFESVESFESAVDDLTDEKIEDLTSEVAKLQFENYFSVEHPSLKNSSNTEMDNVLGQLLNKDGVIQIGSHIFKIDLSTEQVFVISTDNKKTDYEDLINGNTSNKKISVYSVDEDVLYIVNGETREKCSGIGGGLYKSYPNILDAPIINTTSSGAVWRLNPAVDFFRAGVYFRLSSFYQVWSFPNTTTSRAIKLSDLEGITIEMFCRYPQGWYKKKPCGGGDVGTQAGGFYYSNTAGSYGINFYTGSRNLNGYYFYVQGRAKYPNGSVTNATLYAGRNINSPY